jgi:hypothetical protein
MIEVVKAQSNGVWARVRQTSENTLSAIADVVDFVAQMPGNRMVLLASSGFISATLELQLDEIVTHALHAGVVINALDAKGLYATGPMTMARGGDARSVTYAQTKELISQATQNDGVSDLAYSTGGLFFHNNNDLDLGFHELGVRPEVSYLLGFQPDDVYDGKYHKLKVRLTGSSHASVQARKGYMAVEKAPPPAPPPLRRIDTEVLAADTLEDVPASFQALPGKTDAGEPAVDAVFHLDVKRLKFHSEAGVRQQKISFIVALLDEHGGFVTGKQGVIDFALKEASFQQLSQDGINATLLLPAAAGMYRLRAVVQEGIEGKLTASSQPVEIR